MLTGVVNDDIDVSMDGDGLLRDLMQLLSRRGHVQLENICALRFEVRKLVKGACARSGNDFVAAPEGREGQVASETVPRGKVRACCMGSLMQLTRCR